MFVLQTEVFFHLSAPLHQPGPREPGADAACPHDNQTHRQGTQIGHKNILNGHKLTEESL